jgi:hypothetical protein
VDATVARGVVAAGSEALARGADTRLTAGRGASWRRRGVDERAYDRSFACVRVLVLACAGCFTSAVATALSARRTIACGVAAAPSDLPAGLGDDRHFRGDGSFLRAPMRRL